MLGRLLDIVAPRVCHVCGCSLTKEERVMCLACNLALPRVNCHTNPFNDIHRRLGHHHMVDRAAGWFIYTRDTDYGRLLTSAKYRGRPGLAYDLGEMFAREIIGDGFFDGIDILVPMPMYWRKRLIRSYNQAEEIARGVSHATGIPVVSAIQAFKSHGVQARHNLRQRHDSLQDTMRCTHPDLITGRHALIVDDIITSGASVTEAIRALSAAGPGAVSILTLGLTGSH